MSAQWSRRSASRTSCWSVRVSPSTAPPNRLVSGATWPPCLASPFLRSGERLRDVPGSPNPAYASPVSSAYEAEKLFGTKTKHAGVYGSTLSTQQSSTNKAVQAFTEAGWKFLPNCTANIDYNGEANYTPFVQKLQSCGAQVIFNDATPGATLYGAFEAENQIGYDPIWVMDSGAYTASFAQWNTEGLADNVYVRLSYEPLEAAKVVPAVSQYLSIVKKYGGLTSQLGEQATSSFLLWATEAKACGSTLTRQCMINHLSKVTSWTGGGRRCRATPQEHPPQLRTPHEAQGTKWVQAYPRSSGRSTARPSTSAQLGFGDRHYLELPGLRHPVRHFLGPQASGVSAPLRTLTFRLT